MKKGMRYSLPFKSRAQLKKFAEMVKQGKLSQATFDEWNKDTQHHKLPERIHKKKEPKKK
jgi:hypothetical protein